MYASMSKVGLWPYPGGCSIDVVISWTLIRVRQETTRSRRLAIYKAVTRIVSRETNWHRYAWHSPAHRRIAIYVICLDSGTADDANAWGYS